MGNRANAHITACQVMANAMAKDTIAITNTTVANAGKYMAASKGVVAKNHAHNTNTVEHPMNRQSLWIGFIFFEFERMLPSTVYAVKKNAILNPLYRQDVPLFLDDVVTI